MSFKKFTLSESLEGPQMTLSPLIAIHVFEIRQNIIFLMPKLANAVSARFIQAAKCNKRDVYLTPHGTESIVDQLIPNFHSLHQTKEKTLK